MENRILCVYHANCFDGFTAAWVVRNYFGAEKVDMHPANYGEPVPSVRDREIVIVDFSYPLQELKALAQINNVLVLDHHKTAAEALKDLPTVADWAAWNGDLSAVFDMERSGAGITWDFFFAGAPRPRLLDHVEDRDLWRFTKEGSREIHAFLSSHEYDFDQWDRLIELIEIPNGHMTARNEGEAINRKHMKDVLEILGVTTTEMVIGGVKVKVANLPYTMASDGAGKLAEDQPFGACYFDRKDCRVFSLRSRGDE